MLNFLNIALNNNYIYAAIIGILVVIIVITIMSIKKDRDRMVKNSKVKEVEPKLEPAATPEEQAHARIELERVVSDMKNDIDNKPSTNPDEIVTYEQEQEDKAIISYQELVDAVRKNNADHQAQTEVGMEVAETSVIEEPTTVEEKVNEEETEKKVDNIFSMIDSVTPKEENEEPVETTVESVSPITEPAVDVSEDVVVDNYEPSHGISEEPEQTEKKFKNSEFISPVYGKQPQGEIRPLKVEEHVEEPKETPSLDEVINEDLSNSDEFLDALKNFRNNL